MATRKLQRKDDSEVESQRTVVAVTGNRFFSQPIPGDSYDELVENNMGGSENVSVLMI